MTAQYEQADPTVRLFIQHEVPQVIFSEGGWNEGPCYFPAFRTLIWSDIPNDRLMRFDEIAGNVHVFRPTSMHANGNTIDRQGRLITCEHGARRVTRTEFDGSISVLASTYDGKRLNSPNDVVVKSDGSIWFSDPTYGIDSDYFGHRSSREQSGAHVYRIAADGSPPEALVTTMRQPNGLAFSTDESRLYVVDSARTGGPDLPCHIRRFDVAPEGALIDRGIVAEATVGLFDGIRIDDEDRIWAGTGEGVHCLDPQGRLLGKILTGEPVINLCFGGPKRNILYMCTPRRVLRLPVRARGQNAFQPLIGGQS
ncbi:SMP-30/gluconolactonase/LRE family protein [Pontitalea aquivivens]|uniref:SMP-30/gluconolactonase/LRE family protein n=1 Tax=Pontitalea aquivivens TaxID=3388663 RepID=UPI00397104F2